MIQPVELQAALQVRLHDGRRTTTTNVWDMLAGCRAGDLSRVKTLVAAQSSLVLCDHNYMPPLHLAVREGHLYLVAVPCGERRRNRMTVTVPLSGDAGNGGARSRARRHRPGPADRVSRR